MGFNRFVIRKVSHNVDFMKMFPEIQPTECQSVLIKVGDKVFERSNGDRLPSWLRSNSLKDAVPSGIKYNELKNTLKSLNLATVCQSARCPNIGECWNGKSKDAEENEGSFATATIMIMGSECTRACRFCSVKTSRNPAPLDPEEPTKVATAISSWGALDYVVITTVDRDDLLDHGVEHFVKVIHEVKLKRPELLVEVLSGDFAGNTELALKLAYSGINVFAHNVETVKSQSSHVRDRRASYEQSLKVLKEVKQAGPRTILTKSSIMLGCGESGEEILEAMHDLRANGVDCLTLGQYMRPTKGHMKVHSYASPDEFEEWRRIGENLGFKYVASGPLVRSSYRAGEFYLTKILKRQK